MGKVSFDIGDKVVTIKDGELRKGVIKKIFELNPPICIIEAEDGTLAKVYCRDVALAPEPKTETQEESEPVVKSEITITPDEFQDISCRVVAEMTENNLGAAWALMSLVAKLYMALFVEPWEND